VLVLISVRGQAKIGAVMWLEGLGYLKNPNDLIGTKAGTLIPSNAVEVLANLK
jgi:hypothetical protein